MIIETDTEKFFRQICTTEKLAPTAVVGHTRWNLGFDRIGTEAEPKVLPPGQNSPTSNLRIVDRKLRPSDHSVAALKVRVVTEVQSLFVAESKAAKMLDLKKKEFTDLVRKGVLPQPVQLGEYTRWRTEDLAGIMTGANFEQDIDW